MNRLTVRQKAFADYYIECGNASEAARRAGYSQKTAFRSGQENMQKPAISQYIRERMDKIQDKRIAKGDEVLQFLTASMRGEIKDQFGLDATLADRMKAAELLGKRYLLFSDKLKIEGAIPVVIKDDITE